MATNDDLSSPDAGISAAGGTAGSEAAPSGMDSAQVPMPELGVPPASDATYAIDMLGDVELDVKIELGRSQMLVEDVLRLSPGSIVELDKLAGDPVDVYVNERLVARGEVLVVNDNFCVRINEILTMDA